MTGSAASQIAALLREAETARRQGDHDRETRLLEAVLVIAPDHPVAHNSLGMRALSRNDGARAAAHFEKSCAADPNEPTLWANLSSAARMMGDSAQERAALLRALACDQRHLIANVRLAELHEREGEVAAAADRWSAVSALVAPLPNKTPALDGVLAHANAFVASYRQRFGDAIDEGMRALRATLPPPERARADACIEAMLGRRRIFQHQPHGLHFPFLPADEFFRRDAFPWLPSLEAQTPAIRAELTKLVNAGAAALEPYVSMAPGTPENEWTPLDGKLDWGAFFLWKFGRRMDANCALCPLTAAAVEMLPLADMPARAPTVFFSLLAPRTRLPPHTGVTNARAIVHLPLIVPAGCGFRVGGETRAWREGEAFVFDDTIEHEAWNDSDEMRAVLILDVWNPHITQSERATLREFFAVADSSGFDPGASGRIAD